MNRRLPAPWRRFDSTVITVIKVSKSGLPSHNSFSVRTPAGRKLPTNIKLSARRMYRVGANLSSQLAGPPMVESYPQSCNCTAWCGCAVTAHEE